jgi:hypothetical protein
VCVCVCVDHSYCRGAMVGVGWPPLLGAVGCVLAKAIGVNLIRGCVKALVDIMVCYYLICLLFVV